MSIVPNTVLFAFDTNASTSLPYSHLDVTASAFLLGDGLFPPGGPAGNFVAADPGLAGPGNEVLEAEAIDLGHIIGAGADTIEILYRITGGTDANDFGGIGQLALMTITGEFGSTVGEVFGLPSAHDDVNWSFNRVVAPPIIPLPASALFLGSAILAGFGVRRRRGK